MSRHHLPHFNVRVFTVLVFVSLPLMAIAAVMVVGVGQGQLRDAYGLQLTQEAVHTASAVDTYVFRRIIDVSILARMPGVAAVAAAGNAVPADPAKIQAIEQAWTRDAAAEAQRLGIFENPASRFLRDLVDSDRIYREVLVTDRAGRLVAASNVPSNYGQSGEAWWLEAFGDGLRGRSSLSDVIWDESARTHAVEMAIPIIERTGEKPLGILKVVADARELLAVLSSVQVGSTGEAVLIRQDGTIVFSRRGIDPKAQFFAADLLRESLKKYQQGDPEFRVHFAARDAAGQTRLVGIAPSQLVTSYPHLSWMVAVTQAEDELLAPFQSILWRLLGVFGFIAATALAVALWVSIRLAAPPIEPDMHITEHPEVPRIEEENA